MVDIVRKYDKASPEIVECFKGIPTSTIYEAMGRNGAMSSNIKPISNSMSLVGSAITVQIQYGDNLMLYKAIEIATAGDVIVCSAGGEIDVTVWGEIMTFAAMQKKIAGLVLDGGIRDKRMIKEMGFPVFSRGTSLKGASKRAIGPINHTILIGGVLVHPGDIIAGDEDGVVVVPRMLVNDVLECSKAIENEEAHIMERLRNGESAMDIFGLRKITLELGLSEEE